MSKPSIPNPPSLEELLEYNVALNRFDTETDFGQSTWEEGPDGRWINRKTGNENMKQLLDKQFDRLNGPTNYFEGPSGIDRGYRKLATAFGDRDQPGYSSIPNQVRPDAPQDPVQPQPQPGQPSGPIDDLLPGGPGDTPGPGPGGPIDGAPGGDPNPRGPNPYNPILSPRYPDYGPPEEPSPNLPPTTQSAGQAASLFDLARGKQAAPNSLMGMAQMLMKGKDNV